MWTRFMDMHSGGGTKEEPYQYIYIEAPDDEAIVIFYNRFGHNPNKVTCTCCGDDYSIDENESLEQVSAHERNCDYAYFNPKGEEVSQDKAWVRGEGTVEGHTSRYVERQEQSNMRIREKCGTSDNDSWGLYKTLEEYLKKPDVLVIYAKDIKDKERKGDVPEEGYVWAGGE